MDEQRNKIIAAAVVVTILVVVGVLVVLKSSSPKCQLISAKPEAIPAAKKKPFVNSDNTALAYVDAYLEYENADPKEKNVYMPLQFSELKVESLDNGNGRRINLVADCAKVSIELTLSQDKKTNTFKTTHVELTLANGDDASCDSDYEYTPFPVEHAYQCTKDIAINCSKKSKDKDGKETTKKVATLTFKDLEFELDSKKPDDIKKGTFDKIVTKCA